MNLDFGILWIEDSFSREEMETLRRRVLDSGFIARIEDIPNSSGIEELAKQHKLFHRYDLILLDYRLKDQSGNEIAPYVRSLFPSTAILFYSGSVEEAQLRRMIAEREVEGVYCCGRAGFIERAGALIDQTAHALDRLSGMRGLAMRVVAECDDLMKRAVIAMCGRHEGCADKVNELDKDVLEHLDGVKQKYQDAAAGDLQDRLDTFAVDSAKLFAHFRRLTKIVANNPKAFQLDDVATERFKELRRTSAQYPNLVLQKRNILGHVIEVQGEEGWKLEGRAEIATSDFPDLRRTFASHIDAFREITALVLREELK